ncbi:hypothetical protein J2W28_000213 [Variovorax boronicumulans]|uniref:hypothetical protein n=1 Tax=Variovorax boronicumulans TaxID=436515 RepID=UPI0027843BFE|nr:hypothetical protein [Variovorax boronicumulans]MDP9990404.1 hypothetical protein [Variovorax boronicumulans]MDQ0001085.1 hypothetical protein [Variovorax boronicumulans]
MKRTVVMSRVEAGAAPHHVRALQAHNVTGPSAEVVVTGNSNPDFELFGDVAKGVK